MGKNKPKIVIILGPTASGKTDMALALAKKFNGEIINADSKQIYRDLDIGTAKGGVKVQSSKFKVQNHGIAKRYILRGVPIHLVNIAKPNKIITAAVYKKLAEKKIKEIVGWGKLPILCGGTMLYLDMIAKNYKIPKKAPNQRLREKFSKTSLSKLIKELKKIDPPAAGIVDLKNRRRVERALELAMHGRSISEARISKPKFDILKIGIKRPREELYDKINHRVPAMIGEGLVNETEQVLKKYGPKVLAETIGYKEILDWIKTGKKSGDLAKTIEKIQTNTRHYAKRQMTWWRRDEEIRWVKDAKTAEKEIIKFISLN